MKIGEKDAKKIKFLPEYVPPPMNFLWITTPGSGFYTFKIKMLTMGSTHLSIITHLKANFPKVIQIRQVVSEIL